MPAPHVGCPARAVPERRHLADRELSAQEPVSTQARRWSPVVIVTVSRIPETDNVTDQLALIDSGTNDIRGGPSCLSSVYSIGRVPAVPADAAQSGCRFTEERPP